MSSIHHLALRLIALCLLALCLLIPGCEGYSDPYRVLNLPRTASETEVKKAYRKLAQRYHPDKV
jgi:preprotein translocase subunit Sec63